MAKRNGIESSKGPGGTPTWPGYGIRQIRRDLRQRHLCRTNYQVAGTSGHRSAGSLPTLAKSSDTYQAHLYAMSRSSSQRARLLAVREMIATSPYTWEDLPVEGSRERIERAAEDDALLTVAVDSVGELKAEERPYLGKFVAEQIHEMLAEADADYWRSFWFGKTLEAPLASARDAKVRRVSRG